MILLRLLLDCFEMDRPACDTSNLSLAADDNNSEHLGDVDADLEEFEKLFSSVRRIPTDHEVHLKNAC